MSNFNFTDTMDIYSPWGTKVIFSAVGGHDYQKEQAEKVLKLGNIYTIYRTEIRSSSTVVCLREVSGEFNSCLFSNTEDYGTVKCPNCEHQFKREIP